MLLASELTYAGQGYCVALARFETTADAGILCTYLDRYFPQVDLYYDQHWAMGALLYLDQRLNSDHASRFLTPGGLWQRSAMRARDPADERRRIDGVCAFASACMGETPDGPGDGLGGPA